MKNDIIGSLPFKVFALEVDGFTEYWIHQFKHEQDFHNDVLTCSFESKNTDPGSVERALAEFLQHNGYINIADLVSAEYKGLIVSTQSRFIRKKD